jgi:hypothetical protein
VAAVSSEESPQQDSDGSNNAAQFVTEVHSDADGVSDSEEVAVPNLTGEDSGDGNGDGIPDSEQEHVASLRNATDGSYVTIASETNTRLVDVRISSSSPAEAPPAPNAVEFADGYLSFGLETEVGFETSVTVFTTKDVNSYLKFGPTPDNQTPHWYEFLYDGTTGAEILEGRIILHFVDGGRGDSDLAANGSIQDPGAPVFKSNSKPASENDSFEVDEDVMIAMSAEGGVLANVVRLPIHQPRITTAPTPSSTRLRTSSPQIRRR